MINPRRKHQFISARFNDDDLTWVKTVMNHLGLTRAEAIRYCFRHVAQEIEAGTGGHDGAAEAIAAAKGLVP